MYKSKLLFAASATPISTLCAPSGAARYTRASRGMKSGGRGPVYAVNLCSLLEKIPGKRLTIEMIVEWIGAKPDLAEIHVQSSTFAGFVLPELQEDEAIAILDKGIEVLAKSKAYPYGLTDDKIIRLKSNRIKTIQNLADTSDEKILKIDMVGPATVKRIRNVMLQAIWM